MDKRFLLILGLIVVGFIGLLFFTGKDDSSAGGTPSENVRGKLDSKVELTAYKDFECGPCASYHPLEEQVYEKYKDSVKFRFRHYPIESSHPNTRAAHRAAEAAGKQGKFFEMANILFINQQQWYTQATNSPIAIFEVYAKDLGLNIDQFKSDFASEAVNSTISADKDLGTQAGVKGTPSYYINDVFVENQELTSVDDFSKKLDEALANSSQ
ncbi:MAG: DsbA family protein [Patescibacteria group bacterium]|jgi:protein-disulfide isomerase|nr:DsbA family protein [Patescibacteria group bacterium]